MAEAEIGILETINLKNIHWALFTGPLQVFFISTEHNAEGFSIKQRGSELLNQILTKSKE